MHINRYLCIILSSVLLLTSCGNNSKFDLSTIGATENTDIIQFTVNALDTTVALSNVHNEDFFTPKEYDTATDTQNPFVAQKGHTLIAYTCTIENIDRGGSISFENFVSAEYKGETYRGHNELGAIKYSQPEEIYDVQTETVLTSPANKWLPYRSSNMLIKAGNKESCRGYIDIPVDYDEISDEIIVCFDIPNSNKEKEKFYYSLQK